MKKKMLFLIILLLTVYILLFPADAIAASAAGLVLWYEKVVPTLLPFSILSAIFIDSNAMDSLTKSFSKIFGFFLPTSSAGCFVIFSGFLFGFPMGSKNCAKLLKEEKISKREAEVLFCIANNISPVFVNSYILTQQLNQPEKFGISLIALYAPALFLGAVLLRRQKESISYKKAASGFQMNFKIIDAGIMNGFETLVRIGGYIMLFSILNTMIHHLPLPNFVLFILTCTLEITNAVSSIAGLSSNAQIKYILAMTFTAFGGLSGMAQTSSMIKGTPLSMKKYCLTKVFLAVCTAVCCILFCRLF